MIVWACLLVGSMPAFLHAQRISEVFSCAGGDAGFSVGGTEYVCLWNLGEPITETFGTREGFDASKKRLTQGFEQGDGYVEDPFRVGTEAQEGFGFVLYPNPTRGRLQGRVAGERGHRFRAELRSLSGNVVAHRILESGNFHLDLTGNPDGIYVFFLTDFLTGKTAVCKIVKVS